MVDTGRGKFGSMTSSGLFQARMLFGMKCGDGSNANTSDGGNGVNRMTCSQLGEDGVLLSSRERSHDSDG